MYASSSASPAQRTMLATMVALWLILACWLLVGNGLVLLAGWFGWQWRLGDLIRRTCLALAFSIYYIRLLFTWFSFLKRGMDWSEAFTIGIWILCIYIFLALEGGTNPAVWDRTASAGLLLFITGSWLNSYAEYTRKIWKQQPANRGRLYTLGLFQYVRHPNYFGDLLSFSGLCLIAGRWLTALIPSAMLLGFVFVNIPALDSHLHKRYGGEFDDYAKHTHKLIPFVY